MGVIKRGNPPYLGEYALPGGFVDVGETTEEACIREAFEETNITIKIVKLIGVYSDPKRDPRGHTVSIAYLCEPASDNEVPEAKTDAAEVELIPFNKVKSLDLAFDHTEIIRDAGIIK